MSGGPARITLIAACDEPATGRSVVRLETDWPHRDSAVYVLPEDAKGVVLGDTISWTTRKVHLNLSSDGRSVRKIGYAFDPYPDPTRI